MLLLVGVGLVPFLDVVTNTFDQSLLFTEYSYVELTQTFTLLVGIIAAGYLLYRRIFPQLSFLIVTLLTCALVREADSFLDLLADGLWQAVVALILVGALLHLPSKRQALNAQIAWLGNHFSCGLMLSGFVIATGFSRTFGQGALWERIMGDQYNRSVKNFAEESLELLGYVILVIGVIEFCIAASRQIDASRAWDFTMDATSQR